VDTHPNAHSATNSAARRDTNSDRAGATHRGAVAGRVAMGLALGAGALALLSGPLGAQSAADRPAGDYIVVGGSTTGGFTNAIYVLDTANRELVALRWNESTKSLEGSGFRDLVDDLRGESER